MRGARALGLALLLTTLATPAADAAKKPRQVNVVWTHPAYAELGVASIALLPAASYDNNPRAEQQVEGAMGLALKGTGYRWMSSITSRDMLRRGAAGDSLLKAVRQEILKSARADSLSAPRLCALLRTDALLCVRVERWEQVQIEWDQSGKPTTTVGLRAALVDSLGRLLWSASGTELAEGSYHEASPTPIGVKSSGLGTQMMGGESAPPAFDVVLTPLLARWAPQFPPKPAAAAPQAAPDLAR